MFQLNTIQRLTETRVVEVTPLDIKVPIKHYPTINWNTFHVSRDASPPYVPIKHYPTINWNFVGESRERQLKHVPIKHYPTINWNSMIQRLRLSLRLFQLNTIQRLTET